VKIDLWQWMPGSVGIDQGYKAALDIACAARLCKMFDQVCAFKRLSQRSQGVQYMAIVVGDARVPRGG